MTTQAKHTPGPWRVAAPPDKVCTGYGNDNDYCKNGAAKTIVVCKSASWMSFGEQFANASLIAAAPDLLQHLKDRCADLRASLDCVGFEWDRDQRACAELDYAASMALIARVEGHAAQNVTRDQARNEIARREDAGFDARVPLIAPANVAYLSDAQLRQIAARE